MLVITEKDLKCNLSKIYSAALDGETMLVDGPIGHNFVLLSQEKYDEMYKIMKLVEYGKVVYPVYNHPSQRIVTDLDEITAAVC